MYEECFSTTAAEAMLTEAIEAMKSILDAETPKPGLTTAAIFQRPKMLNMLKVALQLRTWMLAEKVDKNLEEQVQVRRKLRLYIYKLKSEKCCQVMASKILKETAKKVAYTLLQILRVHSLFFIDLQGHLRGQNWGQKCTYFWQQAKLALKMSASTFSFRLNHDPNTESNWLAFFQVILSDIMNRLGFLHTDWCDLRSSEAVIVLEALDHIGNVPQVIRNMLRSFLNSCIEW